MLEVNLFNIFNKNPHNIGNNITNPINGMKLIIKIITISTISKSNLNLSPDLISTTCSIIEIEYIKNSNKNCIANIIIKNII